PKRSSGRCWSLPRAPSGSTGSAARASPGRRAGRPSRRGPARPCGRPAGGCGRGGARRRGPAGRPGRPPISLGSHAFREDSAARAILARMGELAARVAAYGVPFVFVNVLVEQLGIPVPALPSIMVAAALASQGRLSFALVALAALSASLLADTTWFFLGRR